MHPEVDLSAVAEGAADDAGGLDTALLGDFLPTVVDAARTGRRLRPTELRRYAERGAAAATGGVPLRATVDLYLSASWRLWEVLPVVASPDAAAVRAAGLAVLRAADDGVAALCEGFQIARNDLARRQESARYEVVDALLAGGAGARRVLDRAHDLGVDLAAPHAVLVARDPRADPDEPASGALLGRLERVLQGRLGDAAPLVAARAGRIVVIADVPDDTALAMVSSAVARVLGLRAGEPSRAAVGRPVAGPDGVRASYEQADDALGLADRLGLREAVVDAGSLAVFRLLVRDRAAAADLVRTALGPLAAARGGAEVLLATLDAYYGAGATATETARRLHLSVRAVTYRLAAVARLLGTDPTDPANRLTLHAAVTAARLLDWPRSPLEG